VIWVLVELDEDGMADAGEFDWWDDHVDWEALGRVVLMLWLGWSAGVDLSIPSVDLMQVVEHIGREVEYRQLDDSQNPYLMRDLHRQALSAAQNDVHSFSAWMSCT
jgi:hypothetical protein